MSTAVSTSPTQREPALVGQTVVLLGGSAGIGLETARLAHAEGADVILVGRIEDRRNDRSKFDLRLCVDVHLVHSALQAHQILLRLLCTTVDLIHRVNSSGIVRRNAGHDRLHHLEQDQFGAKLMRQCLDKR